MEKKTINKFLKFVSYKENRLSIDNSIKYKIDDNFVIEVRKCESNLSSRNDLMNIWVKHGYISRPMPSYISIHTYYTNPNDNTCYGYYNITEKRSEDKKRTVINFDYLRKFTDENINELVAECIKMYKTDDKTNLR